MGLVKFNNTTLNVENVPDGHRIVSEEEFNTLKSVNNAYTVLKSHIPVGVNESQFGLLLEKGQKYDPLAQELATTKTGLTEATSKLTQFSNIPQGFSVEQWNKDRTTEKQAVLAQKKMSLTKQVLDNFEKQHNVRPKIDERFLPPEAATFDFDAPDAADKWAKILNAADNAQIEFMKNIQTGIPQSRPVGQSHESVVLDGKRTIDTRPADSVSEAGVKLRQF